MKRLPSLGFLVLGFTLLGLGLWGYDSRLAGVVMGTLIILAGLLLVPAE